MGFLLLISSKHKEGADMPELFNDEKWTRQDCVEELESMSKLLSELMDNQEMPEALKPHLLALKHSADEVAKRIPA